MFFGKEQYKSIVLKILKGGKDEFIKSLVVCSVKSKFNASSCPVCFKNTSKKPDCWMITDGSGLPLFKDRFDKEGCATLAVAWLRHLHAGCEQYLATQNNDELTAAKIIQNSMPSNDDAFNKVVRRKILGIQSLNDFIAQSYRQENLVS